VLDLGDNAAVMNFDVDAILAGLSRELSKHIQAAQAGGKTVYMVGVHTGGAWVAEHLHGMLKLPTPLGYLSSAFHRDDFGERGLASNPKPSQLSFDINGADILLVDDVLFTGRTVRASINELFDHGRPSSVSLVVLIDRGGRQLPIEAKFVGQRVDIQESQELVLSQDTTGRLSVKLA
jgi:pyrimidine operon attenuation protein / uracil phosphoribosyltransferase